MKYVNMTDALKQVREKAPDTADAMKRHKAGTLLQWNKGQKKWVNLLRQQYIVSISIR